MSRLKSNTNCICKTNVFTKETEYWTAPKNRRVHSEEASCEIVPERVQGHMWLPLDAHWRLSRQFIIYFVDKKHWNVGRAINDHSYLLANTIKVRTVLYFIVIKGLGDDNTKIIISVL